ncbi:MGMT family protein [Mucilaginibacter agri]|uniref:Methylated-DNA--[protein]-cysteine S-methyltransferase n=1 Tax=Mucilaginibacter agri TaxID=2695265 RepID=A0A966DU90_9SPHI|nr:MGMT family protein [Mucilaginibacter agri]NCD69429.1 methylated-DNA--[protein]-cysteine S-methyltransferase [Mucilaginibacter agri]
MDDPNFFNHIYEVTRQIPAGRVTSYGAIAKFLGSPNYSRMVGRAMGECGKAKPPVPYHRVVNSTGHLTGDPSAATRRRELLQEEGVSVKEDKIQNFKKVFWDPSKEINYE